jgi:phospholipid/cholesterol/gamma-HCH transport system permease protein
MEAKENRSAQENLSFARTAEATLVIHLAGAWRLHHGMPTAAALAREFATPAPPRRVIFETTGLGHWDSSLVSFVAATLELCRAHRAELDASQLPPGLQHLIKLAEAVPEKKDAHAGAPPAPLLERIGKTAIGASAGFDEAIAFVGEITIAFGNLARGKARYRKSDLLEIIQQCGANAFGIVALIAYLVGMILAFMGAVQLQQFGAAIYVADLVGIGLIREMGAMMTAIIMAGRTGAAFAAQLGTMKVTQEIDALATMGLSPMEFLVLPRMLALIVMMPLLCLYANFVGVLGGATVGVGMLHLSFHTYMTETAHAVHLGDLAGGLAKGTVYGALVAYAGCLRGFQCGYSSSAVGDAATAAVVSGMVMIVVACGIFAILFHILGI